MKIILICPECKKEREFDNWWQLMFGEDRAIFQQKIKEMEKSNWLKELPERMNELRELEQKAEEIKHKLPREELLELQLIHQKIYLLYNHIKFNEKN